MTFKVGDRVKIKKFEYHCGYGPFYTIEDMYDITWTISSMENDETVLINDNGDTVTFGRHTNLEDVIESEGC